MELSRDVPMGTGFLCDTAVVIEKTIKTLYMTSAKKCNLNDERHYDVISYKSHVAEFLSNTNVFKM